MNKQTETQLPKRRFIVFESSLEGSFALWVSRDTERNTDTPFLFKETAIQASNAEYRESGLFVERPARKNIYGSPYTADGTLAPGAMEVTQ